MSYTMYTPLNVWLDPASVTDVVAYIQNYLSENTIYSEEEIEELIHDYLIAHPELIGGVQSVNGKTGTVVLTASDIKTANNVTIESVLSSLSSQISSIAASVATNTTNITNLTGRVTTAETDLSNLKSSFEVGFNHYDGTYYTNKAWSESGTATLNDATGYTSTGLIPVGTTSHKRFRSNQRAYLVIAYDSNKQFVRKSNYNAFAVQFEQNGYVAFVFLTENFNSSSLMIAYTDETGGATSDTWNTLFPNIEYLPYEIVINPHKIEIDGTPLDEYPLNEINDKMPLYQTEIQHNVTWRYGYVTSAGNLYLPSSSSSSGGYYVTKAIGLRAGETIVINGSPVLTNLSAIANATVDGDVYAPIVVGDGVTSLIEYTATNDIKVYVSQLGNTATISIKRRYSDIIDKIESELPQPPYSSYIDFSLFETFGVIGDSYASGELAEDGGVFVDHYNISWGQIIARNYGLTCTNFSKGGLNTRTWLTDAYGLSLLNSETAKNMYICALGINDYNSLGLNYLGSASDIGTEADTFYGNYSRIINDIKTKAPNAPVFMLSIAGTSSIVQSFNAAIETIASTLGVLYVNQNDDEYISSALYENEKIYGHPRATGYARMATSIVKLIQKAIANNYEYMKDYMK